jgi:hypothetical protein
MNKSTRFLPGSSGNKNGRPRDTRTATLRQMIMQDVPAVIATLIEQAKAGDTTASKLLLDKVLPSLKSISEPVIFDIASNDSLANVAQSIVDNIARGEIAPDVGSQLISALAGQCKIIETTEILQKIEALEGGRA